MSTRPKIIQARATTLKSAISASETGEIILARFLDLYGNQITTADVTTPLYFTIAPGGDNEEIISCTSFTVNDDGSVSLDTDVVRGYKGVSDYTNVSDNGKAHGAGTPVVFSNNPQLYEAILAYIDGIALSGAPSSSTTVQGMVEQSTLAETNAGTANGATGAPLSITPAILAASKYGLQLPTTDQKAALAGGGTLGTPSTDNKYLTEAAQYIAPTLEYLSQDSAVKVGESDATTKHNQLGFSFIADYDTVSAVRLYKKANTGTFTGTVTISIVENDAGAPGSTTVVTKTLTNDEWGSITDDTAFTLHFDSNVTLTVGNTYWVKINPSTNDDANHINVGAVAAGGNANSTTSRYNSTDGWDAITPDVYYQIINDREAKLADTGQGVFLNDTQAPDSYLATGIFTGAVSSSTAYTTLLEKSIPPTFFTEYAGLEIDMLAELGDDFFTVNHELQLTIGGNAVTLSVPQHADGERYSNTVVQLKFIFYNNGALNVQKSSTSAYYSNVYPTTPKMEAGLINGSHTVDTTDATTLKVAFRVNDNDPSSRFQILSCNIKRITVLP